MTPERYADNIDAAPIFTPQQYADAMDAYIEAGLAAKTLRPNQLPIFTDVRDMFRDGETKGYVQSPTGSGKTVVFVEIIKALLTATNEDGEHPRFLIVDPLKDLVHQTIGASRQRGFGKFAPGLEVGTFFSDSTPTEKERVGEYPVVLTTYASLKLMENRQMLRTQTQQEHDEFWRAAIVETVAKQGYDLATIKQDFVTILNMYKADEMIATGNILGSFNVLIFDEGHHVMGENTSELVDALPPHVVAIGFTASPDANVTRQLANHLPRRIHKFELPEAIRAEILAPLVALGVSSDTALEANVTYDSQGEYEDDSIGHLATSDKRNDLMVKIARVLTNNGIGILANTLPGNGAWHARHLAERMEDADLRAVAIHSRVDSKERVKHYEAFEKGELDVMTYYGILGEGYDSERAKAVINGRPTRSQIVTIQRVGRILRPGGPAFGIDIVDRQDGLNYPFRIPDILGEKPIARGTVLGRLNRKEAAFVESVIEQLMAEVPVLNELLADHHRFEEIASQYPGISEGQLLTGDGTMYRTANRVNRRIGGLNEVVLQGMQKQLNQSIRTELGSTEFTIRTTYNVDDVVRLVDELPLTDPTQFYTDDRGNWATITGVKTLFARLYPELKETELARILEHSERPLKTQYLRSAHVGPHREKRLHVHTAYLVDDAFIATAKELIAAYMEQGYV